MKHVLFIFILAVCTGSLEAQDAPALRSHVSFEYGVQFPGGDLAERFGTNFNLGSQFEVLHLRSGWHAGFKGYFMFGSEVKEDVLASLRTAEGDIIGSDRAPAIVFLRQRGLFIGPYAGKVFRLSEGNPLSGIKVSLGAGLLQHKIRLQDDSQSVAQISGEYVKGYDRLSNGLAFYGFVGYQNLDPKGRINFLAGFDVTIASTQSRRDFNFDQQMQDLTKRDDSLIGFRVGWILPITIGQTSEEIFY